jgi:hypothetical protein
MKKTTVLLIIGTAFIFACSTTKWVRTPIVKDRYFTITLEQHQVEGNIISQKYEHPYEIELPDLEKLLRDLTYIEKAGLISQEKETMVFQEIEIERLAPALADTLAKADNSQRIRFTSYNRGKALIFSVSRETEGVIFIEPAGRLNIAFCFINSEIDPTDTTAYPPGFSRVDPLKIKTSDITINPAASYAELSSFETGEIAPMWMIANLEKLEGSTKTEQVPGLLPIV